MDYRSAIYHYCNYQERCQQEVRYKLIEIGCRGEELEELISELIEKDLLNEERYAKAIARGKFHVKHWGRIKIFHSLRLNKISDYCIKSALKEIDPEKYATTLKKLLEKKWHSLLSEKNIYTKKSKAYKYLQQKGYESDLIQDAINTIITEKD